MEIRTTISINKFVQDLGKFNLAVNPDKTQLIEFNMHLKIKDPFRIFIDDQEIKVVNCVRFLELYIDSKLSWDVQVENFLNKLSGVLFLLRRVLRMCDLITILTT